MDKSIIDAWEVVKNTLELYVDLSPSRRHATETLDKYFKVKPAPQPSTASVPCSIEIWGGDEYKCRHCNRVWPIAGTMPECGGYFK